MLRLVSTLSLVSCIAIVGLSQQPTPKPTPAVVPLFIQDRQFTSTLVLVNVGAIATYADVTVRALDGSIAATHRVQFPAHSQQQVNIGALLDSAGAFSVTTGSITVAQSPRLSGVVITAVLELTRSSTSNPNYINEEIVMANTAGSQSLRAVDDEGNGQPLLAITSLAGSAQHIQVQCSGDRGGISSKTVELGAGETLLTKACAAETIHGLDFNTYSADLTDAPHGPIGIGLKSDGTPGSFAAFALAPHGDSGERFFSSVAFVDPKNLLSTTTVFTGVPVGSAPQLADGTYVPALALANFSQQDRHVTVRYARTVEQSPAVQDVASLVIPAMSSKEVSFDTLNGEANLQNSFLVVADGSPGDIAAKLVAKSGSQLHEVELLGKDLMSTQNGGNHPWSLEGGGDSTLLLFNTSNALQYFNVAIAAGSVTWQKAYPLKPMQTIAISFLDLIHLRIKDDKGNVLPANIQSGQIQWHIPRPNAGRGRLLQSNRETAMARNFSCGIMIDLCEVDFSGVDYVTDGQTVPFGTAETQVCTNTCSGSPVGSGGAGYSYSWSSEDSGTASISGSATSPGVNLFGAGLGFTYIDAEVSDGYCLQRVSTPCTVKPSVTISGPSSVVASPSAENNITLTATGTPSGGTYSWSSGSTSIVLSSTSGASITVSGTAQVTANVTVIYTVSGQNGTTSKSITVQKPAHFPATGVNDVDASISVGCPAGWSGWERFAHRQLTDAATTPAPIVKSGEVLTETLTIGGHDDLGITFHPNVITGPTNASGQIVDQLAFCSPSCPSTSNYTDYTQAVVDGTYSLGSYNLHFTCNGITITP